MLIHNCWYSATIKSIEKDMWKYSKLLVYIHNWGFVESLLKTKELKYFKEGQVVNVKIYLTTALLIQAVVSDKTFWSRKFIKNWCKKNMTKAAIKSKMYF